MLFTVDPIPGLEHLDTLARDADRVIPITERAQRRFWNRVQTTDTGCWIWTGAVADDGYGRITWTLNGNTRTASTHTFALMLAHGKPLPTDRVAAHGCDTPLCVRVGRSHVHLSTQSANLTHAVRTGRHEGVLLVNDSTRRREHSLAQRSRLLGTREPPPLADRDTIF